MPTDDLDYDALGFKCGIEIHQQLDTDEKLFCACTADQIDMAGADTVTRRLRPVASEIGEVDQAAQYEYLKGKSFTYHVFPGVSCLVELDEEPPHPVNPDALDVATTAALLMDCDVPDEIHFMRKTVIDGSNTAGFQRTAIIGLNGSIETEEGSVAITDIELEEESAGIDRREDGHAWFNLDRLGIPLIEVGTDASIRNPQHAREVAEHIGMLLRSTEQVKRGIGTIRQDVNVSIAEGSRVEIKGFQDVKTMDDLVANEVRRQQTLVELRNELDMVASSGPVDVRNIVSDTDNNILRNALEADEGSVVAFLLHGLEGTMNRELCPGLTLGKELATYAMAQGPKGMLHTDEDVAAYGLEAEFDAVSTELGKDDGDVVVLIAAEKSAAERAAQAVMDRAALLTEHVPEETRTAQDDATTRYARPLPGRARMYPETDIPPIPVEDDWVQNLAETLPETLAAREERYTELVGEELAAQVVRSEFRNVFDDAVDANDIEPSLVANVVTNVLGELRSEDEDAYDAVTEDMLHAVIELLAGDELAKHQVVDVLLAATQEQVSVAVAAERFESAGEDEIRTVVQEVIAEKTDMIAAQGEHARGALMGLVMQRLEGADGATVNRVLSEELEQALEE